ncbi:hypothetical protein AB0J82_31150 [Asanoa sp. NPDC049518]|uniref:hypothetical protein n=1 Tax=unclassified Asanoa TaxID=2685164 RepID=UPI00343D7AC2
MNTPQSAARGDRPQRRILAIAIATGLLFSLGGCSRGASGDDILFGLAVIVAGFVATQIPSIVRDIGMAIEALTRAVWSIALIGLVVFSGIMAAIAFVLTR